MHIDIAIVKAKLNLEIDGLQHNLNYNQAMSDISRTGHSLDKGYTTWHIPNIVVRKNLNKTADEIARSIKKRMNNKL